MLPYFGTMKRLLTFALSMGFFIWLPSAFADGNGILSLDAPSSIRQTQNNHKDLLTLRVDNIQVRAGWEVTDANGVFTIKAGSNVGVLQTVKTIVAPVIHVATIYAVDKFDLLNPSYANLTASAVITVEFKSGEAEELGLDDVPRLTAVAGEAANLYTFSATGGSGTKTYTLVGSDDADYFDLDKNIGVLSLLASAQAGVYTLTVEVADDVGDTATAVAKVEVSAALMLSDAPLLSVALGAAVSLHKFIASGGIGRKTYTLAAGDESYFSVNASSGVLSLLATAQEGVHMLTVHAIDGRNVTVDALATVEVLAALKFAAVPSFTVIANVGMNLHTLVANGGIGTPTYTILAGNNAGHFALDAASGVLSLSANAKPDNYVLRIQAMDARANTAQAMVTVGVSAVLSLADAPQPLGGAQGTTVSLHTFVAQGGIGARTYTLLTDDVDNYFSLGAESGVLSLLASATVRIYTLSVEVKDSRGNVANALATVGVLSLYLVDAPQLYAVVGREVSLHTFEVQGADGMLTYTITAGDDKDYFSLDTASGVLGVRSTASIGIYTLAVKVEDAVGNRAGATAIVEVIASLSLATVPPLTVIVGRVAHTLTASGGIGIYTYTILSGDKDGFALDAASGVLSLSVNAGLGRHTLTVQVADARNNTVQAVAMVEVSAALSLADAPPFTVIASVAMSLHMFIASGGIGAPTYEIVSGDESYFSVNASSGVLSLAADAEPNIYVLRIEVTDARDNTDEAVATVGVSAMLSLADAPRLTAVAGEAVSLHTFSAKGGIGTKTYTLMPGDDVGYFDLDKNSGMLSLQVSAQAGVYTLTVQVADDGSGPVGALATVGVSAALMLADAPLLSVALGAAVNLHKFIASGGIGRKTYTLAAGNKAYFSVDANSGVLSLLAAAQEGTHMLTVQAIDEGDRKVDAVATVGVLAALTLAAAPSFTVIASVAMSLHTFIAGGGIGRKTYTLAAGDERYFSVGADSGVLSLSVDAEAGRYTLTVRVMDEHRNSVSAVVMVGVSAALVLADAPLLRTVVGEGGNLHTFAATGGIGDKTYTIAAGNEDYFSLGRSSGVLSMNADVSVGIYTLSVQATDAEGNVVPALATVKVGSLLLRDVMLYAIVGREVSLYTFEAEGGSGEKVFTIVAGNENKYFTLDAGSGVLSVQGSVTVGIYTLSMRVEDADGNRVEALAVVAVEASLFLADMPSLVAFTEITMSLHTFVASGGIGAKTYTIAAAGDGADYFILNATSGVLSVANAAAGVYTLSVTVSDSRGNSAQARGTVEVFEFLSLADVSLAALARLSVEMTLTTLAAGGGYGAKRYTLIADESDYFAFTDSGELSLPPNGAMLAGEYTLSVEVSDSLMPPQRATAAVVVRIAKNGIFMMGGGGDGNSFPRDVWFSLDGKNWSKQSDNNAWPGRSDHQVASHQGRLYLMGGDPNSPSQVWSSADGTSWSSEGNTGWLPRVRFQMVEYKGRLYAMGGVVGVDEKNDVWSWAEGESWTVETGGAVWEARHGHQAVVHNDRMYLLGGLTKDKSKGNEGRFNDVWSSADGSSWSFEGNANWDARYFHQAVSHQGRLYVLGGRISNDSSDVWSWAVGEENWTPETSNGWPARDNFQAVSYDGLLYVMGGQDNSNSNRNDVWSSADGKKWTRVTADAGWTAREKLQAVVFPSPLVIWGVGASETIILALGVSAAEIYTVTAQYGLGPYTYSLTPKNIGIKIDGDGVLLLDDDQAQTGAYAVTVRVEDKEKSHAEIIINIEIYSFALADAPPLFAYAGLAESVSLHAFTAVYGVGESTYELVGDESGYFTLGTKSGVLSVTTNVSVGVYTLSVEVSDERAKTATAVATVAAVPILSLADAPLISVIIGRAVSLHTFTAVGGSGIKTYNLVDAPGFFALGESSGILSVQVVSEAGIYTVSVRVSDESGQAAAVAIVEVAASLSLADASLMAVEKKAVSLHTFAASGGIGARTYTLSAGNETGYFVLDASGGVLSLSANASAGAYTLTVGVEDERGNAATAVATVNISAALSLADAPPLPVVHGEARDLHTFVASGGLGVKTYTVAAGAAYFTVGVASGVLSVDANATVGMYTLSVQAADTDGNVVQALATVEVAPLFLLDAPMLYAIVGREVSLHTFETDGGSGAKVFTIVAGNKKYFTIAAGSGVLSVQANASVGIYTLTVAVDDEGNNRAEGLAVVAVVGVEASLFLADAPSLEALARLSVTVTLTTFAASGGYGAKRYTLIAAESDYFVLDADSGELSLPSNSAMLAGTYTLLVGVSDSLSSPQRATAAATVQIARNRIFVLGGADGSLKNDVWSSADGESWRRDKANTNNNENVGWTRRQLHQAVAHNGRLYVMGGADGNKRNDVWSSGDGANWQPEADAAWPGREIHQAVSYKGRIYVLGGYARENNANVRKNDVWSSADGVTWDEETGSAGWTARDRHQAVVHNGRMYVLGGDDADGNKNDVWSSANGSSWRFEGNADWDARYFYQAVSHAGRLYVLGGSDGNVKSDVWSSVDGRSWVREKDNNVFWSNRFRHQSLSRDGLLYVLGGQDSGGRKKDVWSSADGRSWTKRTDAAWTARIFHQAVVFPPNLVLSGTSETITLTVGVAAELHTFSAQYGFGQYAYSLPSKIEGFSIDGAGVLSADNQAQAGEYTLTVRVEDEEGGHAESIINIEIRSIALADTPPLFVFAGLSEAVSVHAFTAVYEVGESTYELVGDASGYFTLGTASGVLSVTANVDEGVYTLSVKVSDENGKTATAVATVEAVPILSLADAPLMSVVVGKAVSLHTFTAVGGSGTKTYNLVDAPGFFTLGESSGILSVQVVSELGIYTVSVRVSDESGQAAAVAIVEVAASLSLADASLMAVEKKAVSLHTFAASGGVGARTYTLSVGNETGYFVLDAASGVLSLSANASAGEYTLTVGVKDERANIATAVATVNISAALSLAGAPQLFVIAEGETKNLHTFVASGGLGAKTYTVAAGAGYFTIGAASGVLSVDANATVGIYTLSVQAADTDGNVVQALATAQVVSLLLADVMLYAIVGREVSLHTFEAGGKGGAKTYTIVAGDDDRYFRLDANSGVLSVRGSVTVGVYTLSVEVTDAEDNRAEVLAVVAVEASLFLADAPPLTVMAGLALSLHTFAASGGIGVKAYTITAGNEAKYFTLNAMSGVLSLRATASEGFYTLTVQAADEYDNLVEAVATVDVWVALSLAEAPLLEAVAGMTMSVHTFAASGGIGAKTYTLSADNGVGYFAINATSGVLSVASATVGVYTLSVQVSDSRGSSVQARATVQVSPPMSLADAPPLAALARLSVEVSLHTFVASDGIGSKRYMIIAAEADYFALDADSGELSLPSNSAMLAGIYTLLVGVSDSLTPPQRATAAATVQIARNGIFVLGGNESQSANNDLQNDVWWSVDGKSWRENTSNASWTARELHQVVAYRGRMYLMGGFEPGPRDDVWSSLDGKNWSLVPGSADWTARGNHQAVVHNGRMYVLGGRDGSLKNDVWSWAEGEENWLLVTVTAAWSARQSHQAVSHNGRMYVLGGRDNQNQNRNDVWSSADGANWRFEGNAKWTARWLYEAVSHNGRLYVLGGNDGGRRNDVWSSLDGRSWVEEQANNSPFWTKRGRHRALSRDGLLYVLGGNAGSLKKDVWSSPDGKSWSIETAAAGWGAREYHQVLAFPPDLALSGTSETITLTMQVTVALHTVSAQYGFGQYTYSLPPEIEGFSIDGAGVLSADGDAQGGVYALTVRVEDEEGSHAETIINIELRFLALADAPPLSFIARAEAMSLHVFTAIYETGAPTYNLVDDSGHFILGTASGVLSVTANVAVGVYTLSVVVSDESGHQATAVATVEALPLSLADAPFLEVLARLSVAVTLHTFVAVDSIGSKRYTLLAGNGASYFALDADSGELSLPPNPAAQAGVYILRVQVSDDLMPPQRATAVATVHIIKSGIFVLGGKVRGTAGSNDVWLSLDSGWRQEANAAWGARDAHQAVAYKGRLWVMGGWSGGYKNDVWSSADGKSWSLETAGTWSGRTRHRSVAYKGRLYVTGGESGGLKQEVWSWAPGEASWTMTTPPWSARNRHQAVVHNGRLYVLGGNDGGRLNDVWSSADGANWRFEGNAGWRSRSLHQAVSHQGRLYVMGGWGGGSESRYNDVWSSVDGRSWREEKANNSDYWIRRTEFQAVSRDGLLYVMGGTIGRFHSGSGENGSNDVWTSADGKIWSLAGNAGWSLREGFQAVVFPPNLVLSGSSETITLTLQAGLDLEIYTFSAQNGFGQYNYSLPTETEGFKIAGGTGVLSADKDQVSAGAYTLTVRVEDGEGSRAESIINIELRVLALADAPPLFAFARSSVAASLHVFTAIDAVGASTYELMDGSGYFTLGTESGVLSVTANVAAGFYTLSVVVSDDSGHQATAVATVEARALSLADAPPLAALARLSVMVSLHTFVAGDSIGSKRYTIIAAEAGYFVLDAVSGELSLPPNPAALVGVYTLRVEVSDDLMPPQRATAAATVQIARNGIFVLGGNESQSATNDLQNDVWWSVDGKSWRENTSNAGWTARELHQVVAYRGRMYLMGGFEPGPRDDVWSSLDGKNWSLVTDSADWTARGNHQAVVHNGRMYVLGGRDGSLKNDVWSWAEGEENWLLVTVTAAWSARQGLQAVSHNGRLYVLGGWDANGNRNDVWSSADGANWRFEGNAKWTARWLYEAVSHAGRLYVLGGNDGGRRNDVWSSLDGRSWVEEQANNSPFWTKRGRHRALSRDGLLYVLGGNDNSLRKDVWSSPDGKSWSIETAAAGWGAREYHQVLAFPPNLVLSGTSETITLTVGVAAKLHPFSAQYGFGQYTYLLPTKIEGFKIDESSGVLSADSQAHAGAYTLTVRVEDEEGGSAETIINIEMRGLALADAPLLSAVARLSAAVSLHTFVANNGIGDERYTIIVDNAGYFAVDADRGVLSLRANPAMVAGTYALRVEVSDSNQPTPQRATAVATVRIAKNGFLVLGGQDLNDNYENDVWAAEDGKNWAKVADADWPGRTGYQAVVYRGRLYVMGGWDGSEFLKDVWSSADGKTWRLEDTPGWTARFRFQAVAHQGRLYVLGGGEGSALKNDVWSWAEGESSWMVMTTAAPWPARRGHQAVSHNGRIYVLGGGKASGGEEYRDDVWSSPDGVNWSFEGKAEWGGRVLHQAVSHNGRLYVLGGTNSHSNEDDFGRKNDVWSWVEGESRWTEVKANNEDFWTKRALFKALSHDGLLYVMGGIDSNNINQYSKDNIDSNTANQNDVWSSADGRTWAKVADADWSKRSSFQAVILPPNLALSGTGEKIILTEGMANTVIHTFTAQYGGGQYTYELTNVPAVAGFSIGGSSGVLEADNSISVGLYMLTVQVEDEEGSQAETVVQVEIVAASTAALSAGSSIISPPASGGGASALALAGGGSSLLIIAPPASSLARPRTPPTSAGGENIGWRDFAPPQARGVRIWRRFHYELQATV